MKRLLLIAFLLFTVARPYDSFAQFKEDAPKTPRPFKERLFTGGGIIFNYGGAYVGGIRVNVLQAGAMPILGYRVTEKFSVGVGATYIYYQEKAKGFEPYSTNIYGGNVFARHTIWNNLFAHVEYGIISFEALEVNQAGHYTGQTKRIYNSMLPVGGGISQPLGRNSAITLVALYDLLYYENAYPASASPFSFQVGVNVGL